MEATETSGEGRYAACYGKRLPRSRWGRKCSPIGGDSGSTKLKPGAGGPEQGRDIPLALFSADLFTEAAAFHSGKPDGKKSSSNYR